MWRRDRWQVLRSLRTYHTTDDRHSPRLAHHGTPGTGYGSIGGAHAQGCSPSQVGVYLGLDLASLGVQVVMIRPLDHLWPQVIAERTIGRLAMKFRLRKPPRIPLRAVRLKEQRRAGYRNMAAEPFVGLGAAFARRGGTRQGGTVVLALSRLEDAAKALGLGRTRLTEHLRGPGAATQIPRRAKSRRLQQLPGAHPGDIGPMRPLQLVLAFLPGEHEAANLEFVVHECYIHMMSENAPYIRDVAHLREALGLLGSLLDSTDDEIAIAVVGGSAMLFDGRVTRVTRDVDVVAFVDGEALAGGDPSFDALGRHVSAASLELGLDSDWLNFGPISLLDAGLPEGFLSRCRTERFGGLLVYVADRYDLIHMKLYAAADQGPESKHMHDLAMLDPTLEELDAAREWCCTQDVSAPFADEVDAAVAWVKDESDES